MPLIQWILNTGGVYVPPPVIFPVVGSAGGGSGGYSGTQSTQFYRPVTSILHRASPVITIIEGEIVGDIIVGTRFRISAGFISGKEPIDPSILELDVIHPGRAAHTYHQPDIQKKEKGLYFLELMAEVPGDLVYRWKSRGINEELVAEGVVAIDPETKAEETEAIVVADDDWFNRAFDQLKTVIAARRQKQKGPELRSGISKDITVIHASAAASHRQAAASYRKVNDTTRARYHENKARNHETIVKMLRII